MSKGQKTTNLGDEFDDALRDMLRIVLLKNQAVAVDKLWGVGGSQEIEVLQVRLGDELVTIESETYIGLTISGEKSLVEKIAKEVNIARGSSH